MPPDVAMAQGPFHACEQRLFVEEAGVGELAAGDPEAPPDSGGSGPFVVAADRPIAKEAEKGVLAAAVARGSGRLARMGSGQAWPGPAQCPGPKPRSPLASGRSRGHRSPGEKGLEAPPG
jgi:hypothetical protein